MPDIAMCASKSCPSFEVCYRAQAKPCDIGQCYGEFDRESGATKCGAFWPILPKTGHVTTKAGQATP